MSDLGKILKEERERQKKDIGEVSKETRISKAAIMAIEEGKFSELPSYVHCYGFVKKYADFLGINFEEIKGLFDSECSKENFHSDDDQKNESTNYNIGEKKPKTAGIIISLIIVILAGFLTYYFIFSDSNKEIVSKSSGVDQNEPMIVGNTALDNNSEEDVGSAEPSETVLTNGDNVKDGKSPEDNGSEVSGADAQKMPDATAEENATEQTSEITPYEIASELSSEGEDEKDIYTVNLEFSDICWVHVDIDGERQMDFIAEKGLRKSIDFSDYFIMDIGNAAAITISYGDNVFSNLGGYRQPVKNLKFIMDNGSLTYSKVNN